MPHKPPCYLVSSNTLYIYKQAYVTEARLTNLRNGVTVSSKDMNKTRQRDLETFIRLELEYCSI